MCIEKHLCKNVKLPRCHVVYLSDTPHIAYTLNGSFHFFPFIAHGHNLSQFWILLPLIRAYSQRCLFKLSHELSLVAKSSQGFSCIEKVLAPPKEVYSQHQRKISSAKTSDFQQPASLLSSTADILHMWMAMIRPLNYIVLNGTERAAVKLALTRTLFAEFRLYRTTPEIMQLWGTSCAARSRFLQTQSSAGAPTTKYVSLQSAGSLDIKPSPHPSQPFCFAYVTPHTLEEARFTLDDRAKHKRISWHFMQQQWSFHVVTVIGPVYFFVHLISDFETKRVVWK